eukprot:CAMPEP_0198146186 /NCGR_PEP_ID=MMETSP1443-20131203/27980_1 /TAXON_ID=186043 /ORGANISM="Entomoneis sp., Strain CCMP2396" /LENGTH=64 /DNA_ID=CAMNT_0043810053 /DNA_START=231 /DNA_END=425 /DNA_ORIENTATION=+
MKSRGCMHEEAPTALLDIIKAGRGTNTTLQTALPLASHKHHSENTANYISNILGQLDLLMLSEE